MREPTTISGALAWHIQAVKDKSLHLRPTVEDFELPQCGWFKTRVARGGPYVPVRIWIEQEACPETGELLSDEIVKCEVNGRETDPIAAWPWVCGEPITESEFNYMVARADFALTWAPHEPAANPFQRTD